MNIFTTSYKISSDFDERTTLQQIMDLFSYESVKFDYGPDFINSISTPFPLLNFDPRNYSRFNWFGINPFKYISSIFISLRSTEHENCIVEIQINQTRAILIFCFTALIFLTIFLNMWKSDLFFGFMIFSVGIFVLYFYIFKLCIRSLIKKEIYRVIKA